MKSHSPIIKLFALLIIAAGITILFNAYKNESAVSNKNATFTAATSTVTFTAAGDYGATENTARVLSLINKEAPAFHLALGDLSYNNINPEKKWCDYVHSAIGTIPFELISGNHEADGMNGFIEHFASCLPNKMKNSVGNYSREYYFDYPAEDPTVRIILISPNLRFSNGEVYSYASTSPHFKWLSDAIDDAHNAHIPWIVLGMHEDCLSIGKKTCEIGTDVIKLAIDKKVDLILQGHDHAYERTFALTCIIANSFSKECITKDSNGIFTKGKGSILTIAGTGGAPLYEETTGDAEAPYFARFYGKDKNAAYGILKVTATKDILNASFIKDGGKILDTFSIEKK